MNKFDVIVIGAGLGGLSSAAKLSINGKKTAVFDMHNKPGGYATCFTRKNFKFDVSLHNFGPLYEYELIYNIFKELKILNKLEFICFEEYQRLIFPNHSIIIEKGIEKIIEYLISLYPDEKNGIKQFFKIMIDLRDEFDEIEKLDTTMDRIEDEYPMLPLKFPNLVKYVFITLGQLLDKNIKDEELKGIIGNLWWIYGMPPEKLASILYSVPTVNYYNYAGGIIKGSSQQLSDAISDVIIENNGKIFLNTEIKKIIIENNKAIGIITSENKEYYADIIISNSSAYNTFFKLISEDEIDEKYRKKINNLDLSLSATHLYLGLDCKPSQLGLDHHNFNVFESYNHSQNYKWIIEGNFEKKPYSCTNYTAFDKTLSPDGKGIITVLTLDNYDLWKDLSPEAYSKQKENVTKTLIHRLEKIIPGIKDHIEVNVLGTPITMERYTGSPRGAIYGSSQIVEQSGINRLSSSTPIKNLYIVGAYIYPGAGYPSVICSGYKVATEILKI